MGTKMQKTKEVKNVIFTTLSLKPAVERISYYYKDDEYCSGSQQQEPGTKYYLSNYHINKIVITGSKETYKGLDIQDIKEKRKLSDWKDLGERKYDEISTLSYYLSRIAKFCYSGEDGDLIEQFSDKKSMTFNNMSDIDVIFVPDKDENNNDNIKGIVEALKGDENFDVNLFMDMQGGQRTAIYVNNALLQLLGRQSTVYHCKLSKVIATNYTPGNKVNEIVDETERYNIVNLVSGINAFLSYGKTDILCDYYKTIENPSANLTALIESMKNIDDAITYNRFDDASDDDENDSNEVGLKNAIIKLKNAMDAFDNDKEFGKKTNQDSIFKILIDGIKADYGDLLKNMDEFDVVSLAKWCIDKNDYTNAAIVIETFFPSYFVKHGILYYARNSLERENAKKRFSFYKVVSKKKTDFYNINHYYIKNYLKTCGVFLSDNDKWKKEPEPDEDIINILLEHPKRYPIGFYSDYQKDKRKSGISYAVLACYDFISKTRNDLAHGDDVTDDVRVKFRQAIDKLVKICEGNDVKTHRISYCLEDECLKDIVLDEMTILPDAVDIDIKSVNKDRPYGIMNYQINRKKVNKNSLKLYPLGGIIRELREYNKLNDKDGVDKQIKFLKEAIILRDFMIEKFNAEFEDDVITSDMIKKYNKNVKKTYDEKDALEAIKRDLKSREDFEKLKDFIFDEKKWNEKIVGKKEELQKNADTYLEETVKKMLKPYLNDKCKWKEFFADLDKDKIKIIKTAYNSL